MTGPRFHYASMIIKPALLPREKLKAAPLSGAALIEPSRCAVVLPDASPIIIYDVG